MPRCAADVDRLLAYSWSVRPMGDELRRLVAALRGAEQQVWGAAAPALRPAGAGAPLPAAEAVADLLDELWSWVRDVGEAFARAGGGAAGAVATTGAALDAAYAEITGRTWTPAGHLAFDRAAWGAVLRSDRYDCGLRAGYDGRGVVVTGPDGRTYPLVAPRVTLAEGVTVTIDGTRAAGDPSVVDLGGADPGWHVVDERAGVWRHRTLAPWEKLLMAFGRTVQQPAPGSRPDDLTAVWFPAEGLPWLARVPSAPPAPPALPSGGFDDSRSPTPGEAWAEATVQAVTFSAGLLQADDGSWHAGRVVFEENDDGRRRARYLRVDLVPPAAGGRWDVQVSYVLGPDTDDLVPAVPWDTVATIGPAG